MLHPLKINSFGRCTAMVSPDPQLWCPPIRDLVPRSRAESTVSIRPSSQRNLFSRLATGGELGARPVVRIAVGPGLDVFRESEDVRVRETAVILDA